MTSRFLVALIFMFTTSHQVIGMGGMGFSFDYSPKTTSTLHLQWKSTPKLLRLIFRQNTEKLRHALAKATQQEKNTLPLLDEAVAGENEEIIAIVLEAINPHECGFAFHKAATQDNERIMRLLIEKTKAACASLALCRKTNSQDTALTLAAHTNGALVPLILAVFAHPSAAILNLQELETEKAHALTIACTELNKDWKKAVHALLAAHTNPLPAHQTLHQLMEQKAQLDDQFYRYREAQQLVVKHIITMCHTQKQFPHITQEDWLELESIAARAQCKEMLDQCEEPNLLEQLVYKIRGINWREQLRKQYLETLKASLAAGHLSVVKSALLFLYKEYRHQQQPALREFLEALLTEPIRPHVGVHAERLEKALAARTIAREVITILGQAAVPVAQSIS